MRAVIMAGGKGTRLASINSDIPKPMFPILNKPILEYQIESLKKSNITDIILIVGYKKEAIKDYFGNGEQFGVHIDYIEESEPLGTAGALFYLKNEFGEFRDFGGIGNFREFGEFGERNVYNESEDFLLLFGDLMLDIDFNRFMAFHEQHRATITLFGHPNAHPYDSDLLVVDKENRVTEILSKKLKRTFYYHNFVNAGIYCVNPSLLSLITRPEKLDLEKDIIFGLLKRQSEYGEHCKQGKQVNQGKQNEHNDHNEQHSRQEQDNHGCGCVYAYRSTEYVKDMGTPERLSSVSADVENGIVRARNLENKQRAIFLDRDGTINEYVGFLRDINDFKLLDKVAEAVAKINASSFLTIVATNQPVIARGEVTIDQLDEIHEKMETELGEHGAYLDDIFYCPHHPDKGYAGEISELKIDCSCRKPKIGMLVQAAEKYNINLSSSWYIGDTTIDIQTGKNAGMKTILLQTGEAGQDKKYDVKPDYTANDLLEAVDYIMKNYGK